MHHIQRTMTSMHGKSLCSQGGMEVSAARRKALKCHKYHMTEFHVQPKERLVKVEIGALMRQETAEEKKPQVTSARRKALNCHKYSTAEFNVQPKEWLAKMEIDGLSGQETTEGKKWKETAVQPPTCAGGNVFHLASSGGGEPLSCGFPKSFSIAGLLVPLGARIWCGSASDFRELESAESPGRISHILWAWWAFCTSKHSDTGKESAALVLALPTAGFWNYRWCQAVPLQWWTCSTNFSTCFFVILLWQSVEVYGSARRLERGIGFLCFFSIRISVFADVSLLSSWRTGKPSPTAHILPTPFYGFYLHPFHPPDPFFGGPFYSTPATAFWKRSPTTALDPLATVLFHFTLKLCLSTTGASRC